MRRVATLSIALLAPLAVFACASPAPVPPKEAASCAPSASHEPAPAAVEASVVDPRVVRCGVDDGPKNVVGEVDFFPSAEPMFARGPFLAKGFSLDDRAKVMMAKPRPPAIRTVPIARPRSSLFFESASRGGTPLEEPAKTAAVGRRFDISECVGEGGAAQGNVSIELRVASSGAPLDARPKTTDLDERATRCVVELACRLTLPATAETGVLEIRAALSQKAPVFKGNVSVSVSREQAQVETQQSALTKVGEAIKPIAEACAKKHPPASTVSFRQRLAIDNEGHLSLTPPIVGGATEVLMGCVAPALREAVGPLTPALRKSGWLQASFSYVVSSAP